MASTDKLLSVAKAAQDKRNALYGELFNTDSANRVSSQNIQQQSNHSTGIQQLDSYFNTPTTDISKIKPTIIDSLIDADSFVRRGHTQDDRSLGYDAFEVKHDGKESADYLSKGSGKAKMDRQREFLAKQLKLPIASVTDDMINNHGMQQTLDVLNTLNTNANGSPQVDLISKTMNPNGTGNIFGDAKHPLGIKATEISHGKDYFGRDLVDYLSNGGKLLSKEFNTPTFNTDYGNEYNPNAYADRRMKEVLAMDNSTTTAYLTNTAKALGYGDLNLGSELAQTGFHAGETMYKGMEKIGDALQTIAKFTGNTPKEENILQRFGKYGQHTEQVAQKEQNDMRNNNTLADVTGYDTAPVLQYGDTFKDHIKNKEYLSSLKDLVSPIAVTAAAQSGIEMLMMSSGTGLLAEYGKNIDTHLYSANQIAEASGKKLTNNQIAASIGMSVVGTYLDQIGNNAVLGKEIIPVGVKSIFDNVAKKSIFDSTVKEIISPTVKETLINAISAMKPAIKNVVIKQYADRLGAIGLTAADFTGKTAIEGVTEGVQTILENKASDPNKMNTNLTQDEIDQGLQAAGIGLGAGGVMHIGAHPHQVLDTAKNVGGIVKDTAQNLNRVGDSFLDKIASNAKGYTQEQKVSETNRAREVFTGLREGLSTGSMSMSQALQQLNDLDHGALAATESSQATKLRDMLVAKIAENKTPKSYGSEAEAILDIENIAVRAKSLTPESTEYRAIESIAKSANLSPEILAKTLKTYEGVESEATIESRGYLTAGLQLRTEQAKGELADKEKIAKLSDRLDKFYQSTESTYNRLKSGYDNLMGSSQLRSIKVGDFTINKSEAGIAAFKNIMAAKERTMKGILDQAKKANIKLISKPKVQQPFYRTKEGKKVSVPVDDINNVSAIIAPKTSGLAIANPTMTVDENTNFVENQLVGIAVPRHNAKDAVVNATNVSDFTKEDGKGAMAQIRKSIDAAIKAGVKFKIHEPKGHSKALTRLIMEHLKANGYQYANKEWVKSEVLTKNKKPKAVKEVVKDSEYTDTNDLHVPSNKELLEKSSSKGKGNDKYSNQPIDINTIVTSRTEDSIDTSAILDKTTKTHSVVKVWQTALLKLIPSILTEELINNSTKKAITKWESIANLKAKDDPARGVLFLEDGTVNSKAVAAMALSGNEYIMANAGSMNYMDTDTAKKILGDKKASFHNINKIKKLGIPAVVAIDSLGNSVLNYIGLSIGKDVPIEVASKLKAALGQHTLMLMEAKGLVQVTQVPAGEVGAMMGTHTNKPGATVSFIKVPTKSFSTITTQTTATFTKMKEELSTVGTIVTGPTATKPQPKEYKKTRARRNKITVIPEKAIDALNKLSSEKYTVVKSAVEWVRNNTEQAKILMGYQYDTNGELSKFSRREKEAIEAVNMAIAKEVDVMLDSTLDDGMFFDWFFSRNGRFMLDSNTINPQTGKKLHRWVYVSKGNTYNVVKGKESDEFYMAVAQAVGFGIDKKQISKAIAKGKEVIAIGSKELKKALDGEHIDGIEVEHLGAYLTMLDVVEKLENAKAGEAVESKLTMEFDAKTSGFGLKIGQLGFDSGYQEKVGVYVGDRTDVTNISDQLDVENPILDVYQGSASEMNIESMKVTPKLQGIWSKLSSHIPKVAEDGKITNELRNLFKQPFMEFNYAAGLKTLIESFSTKIVEDILNDIAKTNGKGYQDLLTQIKAVTGLTSIPATLREKYSEDIKYGIGKTKSNLQQLLVGLVTETYGQQLENHYKKEYQELIDANQIMNNAFVGMFSAYRQAYDSRVKEIKGITAEQKVAIIRDLQNVFPLIRGPLSNDINEGIPIYDSTRVHAEGEFGPAQVSYFKEAGKLGQSTAQSIIREFEAATKAGAVVPIHYIDGVAMATTINDSKAGLLGVHDAEVVSPNNSKEATHNYNKNWYEIQSSYSVIEAVAEALSRVVAETKDSNKIKVKVPLLEGMSGMEDGEYNVNLSDLAHMTNLYAMRISAQRQEFFNQPMTIAHMAGPVGSAYTAEAKSIDVYNPTLDPEHKYSVEKISKGKVESEIEDTSADVAEEYEVANEVEILHGQLSKEAQKLIEGC